MRIDVKSKDTQGKERQTQDSTVMDVPLSVLNQVNKFLDMKSNPALKMKELISLLKGEFKIPETEINEAKAKAKSDSAVDQYAALFPLVEKYLKCGDPRKSYPVLFFLCDANPDWLGEYGDMSLSDLIKRDEKFLVWAYIQFGGKLIFKRERGTSYLLEAVAEKGLTDLFQFILKADTEKFFNEEYIKSLISQAVKSDNIEFVQFMMDTYRINMSECEGIAIKAIKHPTYEPKSKKDIQPDVRMLDFILKQGVDPNGLTKKADGSTETSKDCKVFAITGQWIERQNVLPVHPLLWCITANNLPAIKRLLQEETIQVNLRTTMEHKTVLHSAVYELYRSYKGSEQAIQSLQIIKVLLAHGADPDLKNHAGKTPRMILAEALERPDHSKECEEAARLFNLNKSPLFKKLDDMLAKRDLKDEKLAVLSKLKYIFQDYINTNPDKRFSDIFSTPRSFLIIQTWLKELDSAKDTPKKMFEKLVEQLEAGEIPSQLFGYILYARNNLLTEKNTLSLDEKSTDSHDKSTEATKALS